MSAASDTPPIDGPTDGLGAASAEASGVSPANAPQPERLSSSKLERLEFSVSGRVSRPIAEVYEAVADPHQLSQYFTTGGARGRLEVGNEVTWDFHDFPGRFPVTVVESKPGERIVIEWEAAAETAADGAHNTTVLFEFEALDGDTRTLVTISESAWKPSLDGARKAFGNCHGWSFMLIALKAWVEHGICLREDFYV